MHCNTFFVLLFVSILAATSANAQQTAPKKAASTSDSSFVIRAEVPPQFRGGQTTLQKFINNRMQYPERARRENVQGDVIVAFRVDEKGDCSNFKVVKGLGAGLDEEALRVLQQMPRWIPARDRGKAIAVDMQMPVSFRINNSLNIEDNSRTKNKYR